MSAIHPNNVKEGDEFDDYLRSTWAKIVELKARVWFAVNIGIWSDKETYGLVYGWQNDWFTDHIVHESKAMKKRENEDFSNTQEAQTPSPEDTKAADDNSAAKGWNGWSGVIANSAREKNIDVGVGSGADISRRRNYSNVTDHGVSPVITETETEPKDTDEDELTFQDASDGRKTPSAAITAGTLFSEPVVAPEENTEDPPALADTA